MRDVLFLFRQKSQEPAIRSCFRASTTSDMVVRGRAVLVFLWAIISRVILDDTRENLSASTPHLAMDGFQLR